MDRRWEIEIVGSVCDVCHVRDDGHAEAMSF